jgi:O-methyltransferase
MRGEGGADVTDEPGMVLRVVDPYADREQPEGPERLYLELMKQCLTRYIFGDTSIGRRRDKPLKASVRAEGVDWPAEAETMIGLRRLDNLEDCITDVLEREIAGDLIETGVWRGGATIFMRAVLKAYGDTTRTVWAADSFQGLPKPDAEAYPADEGDSHWTKQELAVSLDQVKANFSRYGLLDDQVQFLVGWFRDTLPTAPIDRLAVLRLDGDMYESTMVALRSLYPKVSVGGYVIVDDYGAVRGCRKAVEDFRQEEAIADELHEIDWSGVFWQRSC